MKITYPSLSQEKKRSSMDSAEAGCKWNYRIAKKPFPYSKCLIIALPVLSFLALGIYFILVDLKILAMVLNSTETSNLTWDGESAYVTENEAVELGGDGFPEDGAGTQKPFAYSPTVPHVTRPGESDEATGDNREQQQLEGANCFSTRLDFCEGVLPYDLVQLPGALGVTGNEDFDSIVPHFRSILAANCSSRARELLCSLLEPECLPAGKSQVFPCDSNCQVVAEECQGVISGSPILSQVFNCRSGEWDTGPGCFDLFTEKCTETEFSCSSGRCIPQRWVCNGVDDCHDLGSDEVNCPECPRGHFRCASDGRCIAQEFVCDGEANCSDRTDETFC